MMKLEGRWNRTKISAEFEFGGHNPRGCDPPNVALVYDVWKVSVGYQLRDSLLPAFSGFLSEYYRSRINGFLGKVVNGVLLI